MGYDLQRAALVTCCLSALLLAASLMPAAGMGSFPSVGGPPSGDTGPSADPVTPEQSTPREVTQSEQPTVTTQTPTPVETETTETGTETDTTTRTDESTEDDEDETIITTLTGFVGFLVLVAVFVLLFCGAYSGTVLVGGRVYGYESVSWLPFSGSIQSIPQLTMSSLIGTAAVTGAFFGQLRSTLSAMGAGVSALARVPSEFGRVMSMAVAGPVRALSSASLNLGGGLGSLFSLSDGLRTRGSRETGSTTTTDAREAGGPAPADGGDDLPPLPTSVVDAFDRMTDRLSLHNEQAMTPAELADAAIERGWPAKPVQALTSTFRQVRYGGREERGEETEQAVSAYERLRQFWRRSG